ncbi:transposase, partial [Enterobacter hormaechei subsp. steigerwaltii]
MKSLASNNNTTSTQSLTTLEELPKCETDGGTVHIEWDDASPVTPFGQFVFFAQFLNTTELFQDLVKTCPIATHIVNPVIREKFIRNLLGSYLLSILAGHKRYAHITAIRHDKVNPQLLGMTKIYSEDTVRRAFRNEKQEVVENWLQKHLNYCYRPLLREEWILDIDTTVKQLYGHQEGGEIAYNPKKPGRPSHVIHTYMQSVTRLVLDCEVESGTHGPSNYSMPRLLEMLDEWAEKERASLIRGDCAFGNEKVLSPLEERNMEYLFKMKQTKGVKKLIQLLCAKDTKWENAGQGWEGAKSELKLEGWSKTRQVLVLRKPLKDREGKFKSKKRKVKKEDRRQLYLPLKEYEWQEIVATELQYEYSVLVTSLNGDKLQKITGIESSLKANRKESLNNKEKGLELDTLKVNLKSREEELKPEEIVPINNKLVVKETIPFILAVAQLYRDRATCENNFDELKNQWGWGGYVTQDLFRSRVSARIVTLIYNWWTLFVRWIEPDKHRESITSRPLMLHGIGRKTFHAGKTTIKITSLHAKRERIQEAIALIQKFLRAIKYY